MTDVSARFSITEPSADRHDAADVPLYVRNVVAALEGQGLRWAGQGTFAAIPAFGKQGSVYYATDQIKLYYDTGAAWIDLSTLAAGAIGTTQIADHAVTEIKLALLSVGTPELIDSAVTAVKLAASAVTATKIDATLKPSGGAGAGTEALRALGTAAGTAAAGAHKTQHQSGGADQILVTMDMLDTLVTAAMMQPGDIKWVGYNVVAGSEPAGFLFPDGRLVSTVTYAALFAKYGYTHGGSGANFALPDARGKTFIGIGTGAGLTARSIGQTGGEETHVLTLAEHWPHNHGGGNHGHGYTDPTHLHAVPNRDLNSNGVGFASGAFFNNQIMVNAGTSSLTSSQPVNITISASGTIIGTEGSGSAHNNMQPWIALTPLIKT